MARPYVDHWKPRRAFQAALESGLPRVLTVCAASGKGKSTMLGRFQQQCKDCGVHTALLDFKSLRGRDAFTLLGLVRYYLRAMNFSAYDTALKDYLNAPSPGVTLANVQITSSHLGDIIAGDLHRRAMVLSRLTDGLLSDLEASCAQCRIVLLVDTFEQADDEVKAWLNGQIVAGAFDISGLVVVVTGKEIPPIDQSLRRGIYYHCELPTMLTFDDWLEYARGTGALNHLGANTLRHYHVHYQGDPVAMCMICDPFEEEKL